MSLRDDYDRLLNDALDEDIASLKRPGAYEEWYGMAIVWAVVAFAIGMALGWFGM